MNETVEVIVPYWGTDRRRRTSLKFVQRMLKRQGLPTKVVTPSYVSPVEAGRTIVAATPRRLPSGPPPKAAVLWPAIKHSEADILVLHDADCWCDGLADAIETIASGEFVWGRPHRDVVRLSEDSSAYYRKHLALPNRRELSYDRTPYKGVTGGGVVIARTEVLLDCAMDPRFDGWGQEDMALGNAIWTLYGPPLIGNADLIHLYHEPAPRIDHMWGTEANKQLYTRYHHATTDRSEMLQLVAEAHQALEGNRVTIEALMDQPVSITSRSYEGEIDAYGNEIATETQVEVLGYLQQLQGTEREGYVPEATDLLVVPADTLIQANDMVDTGGNEYQVLGPPANIWNPRTNVYHHIEATLRRIVSHQEAA